VDTGLPAACSPGSLSAKAIIFAAFLGWLILSFGMSPFDGAVPRNSWSRASDKAATNPVTASIA
jgi:hypothetical protein